MNYKHKLLYLMLTVIVGMTVFFGKTMKVMATAQTDAIAEANEGLSSAPTPNLGLNPDQFTAGDLSGYNITNYAILQNDIARSTASPGHPLKAIRLNKYKNESGVIWSNVEKGNYVNITKKQTLSLWMYFGPKEHKTSGEGFGDGMAFVLQNSADGIKAFSHDGTTPGGGETLGVWGLDNSKSVTDPSIIAGKAIQNSWALEFDTNSNTSGSLGDDFDANISSGQHIAYGYPGDPSTYSSQGSFLNHYFALNHSGVEYTELHDGNWHHLTLTWNPNDFSITYAFNDKNPDGSKATNPLVVTIPDIKAAAFGGHGALTSNELRWGFTSTNGGSYEANLVAFESIPSEVEGAVTPSITDFTQNKTIKFKKDGTEPDDKTINSGDSLGINYELDYQSGSNDWANNKATITLPSNITYKNGDANQVIGYVTYTDGSSATGEPIYASEMTSDNTLTHTLQKSLNNDTTKSLPASATITIYGTANNVTSTTDIPSAHSQFDSDSLILDTDTPEMTIQKSKPISLQLDRTNISVDNDADASITGTVSYNDGSAISNSGVTVHSTLNGSNLDSFKMDSSTNTSNYVNGELGFKIPNAKLTQETNTLKVYVTDDAGNVSTTSTVIITKKGGLALKVDDYSFGSINQVTASNLIPRKGLWNIIVDDTRKEGTTSPWHLSASTTGLFDGETPFNGNLIFKSSTGLENIISNTSVEIASGYKQGTGEQATNVGESWNDSEGIMLKTAGFNSVGQYSGKVNWTLSDAV